MAIRFINGTPDDNLALAVYRHDRRIAASTAQVGTAQSVIIPGARATARSTSTFVDGVAFGLPEPSPAISYEGLTQVVYDPPRKPLRALAQDLVALPQQNVTFGPPFESFDDPVPDSSSRHESEIDEDGAQTCLRFDRVLGNIGTGPLDTGPLDIRFDPAAGAVPVDGQEIPVRLTELPSCSVHWHAIHQHYHFDGFAESRLWAVDAHGDRVGTTPAATGNKVSFCIATTNINPPTGVTRRSAPTPTRRPTASSTS